MGLVKPIVTYATVPRAWEGQTAVCLATGPSLCQADVDACRGRAKLLAIKDAIRLAPDADCWYGCDAKVWKHYGDRVRFDGPKYTLDPQAAPWAGVLRNTGFLGLETVPSGLKTGKNSGFQAINLAVHFGVTRIILLGYDMRVGAKGQTHFTKRPYSSTLSPFAAFLPLFETLIAPLQALGIRIINATRSTALTCFPRLTLDEALA
jgi:hypothetical protein